MFWVYKWKLQWLPSGKDNVHVYIYKKAKQIETFLYTKSQTICKKKKNLLCFYVQKTRHFTLSDFHEIFEVGIYIQKARYFVLLDFKIKKSQTLRKKEDNLCFVFMFKNPDTLHYAIFIEFLKLAEGGAFLHLKNNALCFTLIYWKNNALCATFYIQKSGHYALHFYMQKTMHFDLRLYQYNLSCIVLIPSYKRTYDQSDQIEK